MFLTIIESFSFRKPKLWSRLTPISGCLPRKIQPEVMEAGNRFHELFVTDLSSCILTNFRTKNCQKSSKNGRESLDRKVWNWLMFWENCKWFVVNQLHSKENIVSWHCVIYFDGHSDVAILRLVYLTIFFSRRSFPKLRLESFSFWAPPTLSFPINSIFFSWLFLSNKHKPVFTGKEFH